MELRQSNVDKSSAYWKSPILGTFPFTRSPVRIVSLVIQRSSVVIIILGMGNEGWSLGYWMEWQSDVSGRCDHRNEQELCIV